MKSEVFKITILLVVLVVIAFAVQQAKIKRLEKELAAEKGNKALPFSA
jgi:hypothetical protein